MPTEKEWNTLTAYLGNDKEAGGKLKETGFQHWISPNTGATNESGFTALPGGIRNELGEFKYFGYYGYWWTASGEGGTYAWPRYIPYDGISVEKFPLDMKNGFSVRCVKD